MENTGKKWEGTKDPYLVKIDLVGRRVFVSQYYTESGPKEVSFATIESKFDANLFRDALTTIQKCGLMPSELIEMVVGLKKDLDSITWESERPKTECYQKAEELIQKIKDHA